VTEERNAIQMSTIQENPSQVKTPKAETTAELTPRERATCHAFAELAAARLYAAVKAGQFPEGPVRGLPSRGKLLATTEAAYDEARSRVLAERDAPEDTAKDALWAAEMAREATEAAQEEAREAEEREGVYDDLHEPGDDAPVWE
jgi:hypothetical protein